MGGLTAPLVLAALNRYVHGGVEAGRQVAVEIGKIGAYSISKENPNRTERVPCGPMWSHVVPCGPMWSHVVRPTDEDHGEYRGEYHSMPNATSDAAAF
jgi:hypothetical protein